MSVYTFHSSVDGTRESTRAELDGDHAAGVEALKTCTQMLSEMTGSPTGSMDMIVEDQAGRRVFKLALNFVSK